MALRLILGAITLEADAPDTADAFLRSLLRHLNNQEVAELLGVTDKTVRRWQRSGRLPHRPGGQTLMLDLLTHLGTVAPQTKRHTGTPGATNSASAQDATSARAT